MDLGEQIKRIRTIKGLSQKEVLSISGLDKAQYSRIENSKTDPSFSTLVRIVKALGVSLPELFATTDELNAVNSFDKSVMEKVTLIESLQDDEKNTLYSMLDAFVGKRKMKDALAGVLKDAT
jgi:transcriptional regulator with XRE-family HTH domain